MVVGDDAAIETVMVSPIGFPRLEAHGELYLTDEALVFVSFTEALPNARGYIVAPRKLAMKEKLVGRSLDEAVQVSEHSVKFAPSEIERFRKSFWTGFNFYRQGKRYALMRTSKAVRATIRQWCDRHDIACEGF